MFEDNHRLPTRESQATDAKLYWNEVVSEWSRTAAQHLWRRHSDRVNGDLIDRWLPDEPGANLLKTDLFDEAFGDGLFRVLR